MIPWKEATCGKKQQEAGVRERHSQSLGSRVMGGGERLREEDTVVGVLGLGAWRILQERCLELCFTVSLAWSEEGKRLGYEYGFRGYSRLQVRGGGGRGEVVSWHRQ